MMDVSVDHDLCVGRVPETRHRCRRTLVVLPELWLTKTMYGNDEHHSLQDSHSLHFMKIQL